MKDTLVPAQIVVIIVEIDTVGTTVMTMVIVFVFEFTLVGLAQGAFEVNSQ